jgi:hypothetical protein
MIKFIMNQLLMDKDLNLSLTIDLLFFDYCFKNISYCFLCFIVKKFLFHYNIEQVGEYLNENFG